jgi:hypothetical protein
MRVSVCEYALADGGTVDIIEGNGWNTVRLVGTRVQVIDKITRLQYDLSVALDTVSEWGAR